MHPAAHAVERGDKVAVVMADGGRSLTYRQLDEGSARVARWLWQVGLRPGDNVALLLESRPEFVLLCWAARRSGLLYTPISTRLGPSEAAYILGDAGSRLLFASEATSAVAARLPSLAPSVERFVSLDAAPAGFDRLDEQLSDLAAGGPREVSEGQDMLYSSGTTGRPKGIRQQAGELPQGTPDPVTLICQVLYGMSEASVYLTPAPLYHAAPLRFSMAATRLGATLVLMDRFDPEGFLDAVGRWRVSHTQVVPTHLVRLLKLDPGVRRAADVSSLRRVIHAAAPCPVPVKRAVIDWLGPIVDEYYAGSEGNGFVAIDATTWLEHPGSVGRPLLGALHIVDESGTELAPGQVGLVYFEGGTSFEYHNDPEKTEASRHPSGWSTLGDIGYVDDEGFLFLTDRREFVIVSGGVNVYPQEAENVLVAHPRVADAAVFGVPDAEMGEAVKAVVQPAVWAEAGPTLEAELLAYCRVELAHYKCPVSIDFDPELPRAPTGKLYKAALRDRYWGVRSTRIGTGT